MDKLEDGIISELENLRERIGRLRADINALKQLSPSAISPGGSAEATVNPVAKTSGSGSAEHSVIE